MHGSIRFLQNKVDPAVLPALGTSAGGAQVCPGAL
jgi:hypothetical protein